MEMQSHDVDVAQVAQHSHHIRYLPGRDSELVLRKARSNITVGVGVDVGIYPQRHVGDHAEFPCKRIYHDKFVFRFAVKGEYTLPQRIDYLAVLFPHTGIDDVLRGEAVSMARRTSLPLTQSAPMPHEAMNSMIRRSLLAFMA